MTTNEWILLGLALVSLAAFNSLIVLRIIHDEHGSRLLFLDLLLAIASAEVVADTLHLTYLALLTQGMLAAGGMALLATYRRGLTEAHPPR